MSETMKAMAVRKYGKQPVEMIDLPVPEPGPEEVLVRVKAASVNPVDFKTRDGDLKAVVKHKFPLVLGNDLAGVVEKVGKDVRNFKVGDKVYGRPGKNNMGTFAQYFAINQYDIALMPKNLDFVEAASIPLVGLTSYQAFHEIMHLKAGDKVLVEAGSGGIGTFAIQLGRVMGLHVATTVSEKGESLVRSLGADEIINYKQQNFWDVLSNYDGVFDTLGGKNLEKAFTILKPGGSIASLVGPPTMKFTDTWHLNLAKRAGIWYLSRHVRKLAKAHHVYYEFFLMHPSDAQLSTITNLIEEGEIKPVIDKVYPFHDTQRALDYSEQGHAKGKIVIKVED